MMSVIAIAAGLALSGNGTVITKSTEVFAAGTNFAKYPNSLFAIPVKWTLNATILSAKVDKFVTVIVTLTAWIDAIVATVNPAGKLAVGNGIISPPCFIGQTMKLTA